MRVVLQVSNGKTNLKRVVIQSDTVIGRSTDCQLRVASSLVSRKHCQISVSETLVSVTDLGSANGTFLNGKPLPPNVPTELASGSEVSIGPVQFLVQFQPPTAVEMPAFSDRYDSADSFSVEADVHPTGAPAVPPAPALAATAVPEAMPIEASPAFEVAPTVEAGQTVEAPPIEAAPAAEAPVEPAAAPVEAEPVRVEPPAVEAPAAVSPQPVHIVAPDEHVAPVQAEVAPPADSPPVPVEPVFTEAPAPIRETIPVARVVARPVAAPAEPVAAAPEEAAPPAEVVAPPVEAVAPPSPPPPPVIDDSEQTITAFPDYAGLSSENADEAAAFDFLSAEAASPSPAVEINAAADDILEVPSMELTEPTPDPAQAETSTKPKRGFWNMLGMGKKAQKESAPAATTPAASVDVPAEPVVDPAEFAEAPASWDLAESEPAPAEAPPDAEAEAAGGEEDDALNDFFKNLP